MESIDPANLADVNKTFVKPQEYAAMLDRLAQRNIYAITSFIFGLDNDTKGVAQRTLDQIRKWPPVLPVFGQLTPYPSTPLYARLKEAGRLTRPAHWMDFAPFHMAHRPLKMTSEDVREEIRMAWTSSYSPQETYDAISSLGHKSVLFGISHFIARLFFRGIYFRQMSRWAWVKLLFQNRRTIMKLATRAYREARAARGRSGIPSESVAEG
jgi:hypothetical protein